jgi:hypothetical protein
MTRFNFTLPRFVLFDWPARLELRTRDNRGALQEPLLEEYSVAAHILKLPQSSLCELARNSVIQSGFEMEVKRHWLGQKWYLPGAAGNDINKACF